MAKGKRLREEASEVYLEDMEETIKEVEGEIDKETKQRTENNEKLVKRLSEEISNFHELLTEEKKVRESTQ